MAGSPSAQNVADALAIAVERQSSSGEPWCPPSDAIALRRWVIDRSSALGGGIRRAVRLARLMEIADGRDYARFLYVQLYTLRARGFRQLLQAAVAEGRLPPAVAVLSDRGVQLREAALAPLGDTHEAFEIDFSQMPRLAALLDFLHNALGFGVVADLLAPLVQRGLPTRSANEVARTLHAALNAWLGERLESATHLLQAQRIRAFLAGRGRVAPECVDDETILLFWIAMAEISHDERVDGFRLYRSAACAMLRYRQALRDAAAARQLEDSLGRGLETQSGELMFDRVEAAETGANSWRSPLGALACDPAARVKWLNRKEQQLLLNFLGGPSDDGAAEDAESENEAGPWKGGLFGDERFDLAFWLTLLRVDAFGAAQASIVARLRKRAAADMAVAQAMAAIDDTAYTASAAAYCELGEQLRLECLAALAVLMEAGAAEAVIILDHLAGQDGVRSVLGSAALRSAARGPGLEDEDEPIADAVRKGIAPALKTAFADPRAVPAGAGRELLLEAAASTRKVNRAGFRREDRLDSDMLAALASGAAAVVELSRELDRLIVFLVKKAATADLAGDRARFLQTFQRMYASAKK